MSPKIALAFLLAASTGLAKGQNASDSIRDSYHLFFPAMGKDILAAHIGAHSYKIVNIYDTASEVYVDDKRIPGDQLAKYADVIARIKSSVKDDDEEREMRQMARDRRQAERDREQATRDREQQSHDREQRQRDRGEQQIERVEQQREREHQRSEQQRERTEQQAERQRERAEQQADKQRDRQQSQREREQGSSIYIETGNGDRKNELQGDWNEDDVQQHREKSAEDRAMLKKGIEVLVEDHIIDNTQHLKTLVLTDSDLSVNGIKQPSNIYQQIRSKLGDWAHNGFSYGMTGSSDYSISIND